VVDGFERLPRAARALVVVVLISVLGFIDYVTGFELSFAFFYVLPVGLAAWSLALPWGMTVSVLSAVVWLAANQLAGNPSTNSLLLAWNAATRLGFFVVVTLLMARLRQALERERALSRTDFLTGALNSRAFGEQAALELDRVRRYGRPCTVLYLDLDNFKAVNDRDGHTAGDQLLRTVAQAMRDCVRRTDLVARLGGDEFAVLLPETNAAAARHAAEHVRSRVLEAVRARDWPVTVSIGALTCVTAPDSADALIRLVDHLMHEVKHSTKDGVAFGLHDTPPPPGTGSAARVGAR